MRKLIAGTIPAAITLVVAIVLFATGNSTNTVGASGGMQAISGGILHTCALNNGGVLCWGANHHGQVGDGTFENIDVPLQLTGAMSTGVTAIAAGYDHTCALK